MNMNVYAPMLLCLVPLIATFLLLAILVPGISILRELIAVLAGLLALVPIVILQFLFLGGRLEFFIRANLFFSIIHSLIFFGLIEEGMKTVSLLILKARGENLKIYFAYSILAGMALGCFESVVYLLSFLGRHSHNPAEFLQMIFLRMVTSLVIHTLCAGLGGLCIFGNKNLRRDFSPLIFAIFIHGIYDFFAASAFPLKYFSVAAILLAILECRIFYLRIREGLASKSPSKISDSEKTIEIPKSPALVISVKGEAKNSSNKTQGVQKEEKMLFRKNVEDDAEDFEKIQAEAEAAIKAEESKKTILKKSAKQKNDSEKTTVKNSASKEKTVAKKSATKNSPKKNSTKQGAAKSSTKKASAPKSKSASEKKSAQTKAAPKKSSPKKPTAKKATATKKSVSKKKVASAPAKKK